MKVKSIPSGWMRRYGRRLDCGPYMSRALEAQILLDEIATEKEPLPNLCLGGMAGLVNAGRITRQWVDGPPFGVPFLTSTSILQSNLSNLRFISNRAVDENPQLIVRRGYTLITRAGTIGRMSYTRPDMDGMACTEDVLRVIPDERRVPAGYLYAFLNSDIGKSLVTSGTYGAIIQHIEPEHLARIQVPRFGARIEREAHELIERAAELRSQAAQLRSSVLSQVTLALGWHPRPAHDLSTVVSPSAILRRMDAFHHAAGVTAARRCLATDPSVRLGDVASEVFEPNRGARRKVDDAAFGVPFLSSSEVFRLDPVGDYLISRTRTPHIERQLVGETDLLIPRSGQLGGIVGKAVLPLPSYYGSAASEHLVRIRCHSREDAFYAWAILATEPGYYAAIGTAFGSSIPSLDCALLADLRVPWWQGEIRDEIVGLVGQMVESLSEAITAERSGVALVEQAIKDAA